MAKARRKLRRQLMKKAKKGYLTPGEREDLMQLDREVNKANRQAAAVGVPALSAALAMAARSGALYGMGDSLSGFLDDMKERRERKEEEEPIETTDANQEVSGDDQLRRLQEENNKELQKEPEGSMDTDMPEGLVRQPVGPRAQVQRDIFSPEDTNDLVDLEERMVRYPTLPNAEQESNWPYVPGTEERLGDMSGEELAQMMAVRKEGPYDLRPEEEDKYLDYLGLGQDQRKPRPTRMQRRMLRRGFDPVEGEFLKAETFDPKESNPTTPQKMGGYTPFLSRLRNKFQKRLTGRR